MVQGIFKFLRQMSEPFLKVTLKSISFDVLKTSLCIIILCGFNRY